MTRRTSARVAGFTFLFYIAAGIASLVLSGRSTSGEGIAAKLAGIAQHTTEIRIVVILSLLTCLSALVLAVTLYAITRDQDPDLARLAMISRVGEGLVGLGMPTTLGLLWLATAGGDNAPGTGDGHPLAAFLLEVGTWQTLISASLFAVGSTLFSWLLLRGRMIPVSLAWLGVVASVLLLVVLPLQLAGFVSGTLYQLIWVPMAVFELVLGPWLIIKGAAPVSGEVHA